MKDYIQQDSESLHKAFQFFHGCRLDACSLLQQGKRKRGRERMRYHILPERRWQQHKGTLYCNCNSRNYPKVHRQIKVHPNSLWSALKMQQHRSVPCLLDLSRSNKQRAMTTDGKESLFFCTWSWRYSIMTASASFALQLSSVSTLSYASFKKEWRVPRLLVLRARSPIFPWQMLDILPSITEATNKRKSFESRDSFMDGSLEDISKDLWLEYNQKMFEVAQETTFDILDLSCQTKANTYDILYNPWADKTTVR